MVTDEKKVARKGKGGKVRERRRSTRVETMTAGRVGEMAVQVFDVSLDGVGFRTESRPEVGAEHPILIGNGPMYLEGRVRVMNVRVRRDGTFDVGGVFV
jgi:hypothetical protein